MELMDLVMKDLKKKDNTIDAYRNACIIFAFHMAQGDTPKEMRNALKSLTKNDSEEVQDESLYFLNWMLEMYRQIKES